MNTNSFISDLGDLLGEDFIYAPLWTRDELHGYTRKALRRFSELTAVVDDDSFRAVDSTYGEANVPKEFEDAYYVLYNKANVDLAQLGEMDLVQATWLSSSTGSTPFAATIYGSGQDATVRVVPVPSNPSGAYGASTVTGVTLADSGGIYWMITVGTDGVLTSTSSATGTTVSATLTGPTTYWDMTVAVDGAITTVASVATSGDAIVLTDIGSVEWTITATDAGVVETDNFFGECVRVDIDSVPQDFGTSTTNYGVLVDAYAQGATSTPTAIARIGGPYGEIIYHRTSTDTLQIYYKARMTDVPTLNSEIYLSDAFIPVLQHGVLAMAYNHDGSGRDPKKATVLDAIFKLECESIRRMFQRK